MPGHARAALSLAALLAVLVVGCSEDDQKAERGERTTPTAAETTPAKKDPPRGRDGKASKERKGGKRSRAGKKLSKAQLAKERRALRRETARDRRADRKFDRAFKETAFEKLVAQLPIRKPPLFVEQYITSRGSATVYTAVAPKRFFCGRSAARRKAAVSAFYRDADKLFRRGGVENFVQVVTPVAETTERLPALAVGRKGSVSLTKRGRAKGPC